MRAVPNLTNGNLAHRFILFLFVPLVAMGSDGIGQSETRTVGGRCRDLLRGISVYKQNLFPPKPLSEDKRKRALENLRIYIAAQDSGFAGLFVSDSLAAASKHLRAQGVAHVVVDDVESPGGKALQIIPLEKTGSWLNQRVWELHQTLGVAVRVDGRTPGFTFEPGSLWKRRAIHLSFEAIEDPTKPNYLIEHEVGHANSIRFFRERRTDVPYGAFSGSDGLPMQNIGVLSLEGMGYSEIVSADEPNMQLKTAQDLLALYTLEKSDPNSDPQKVQRLQNLGYLCALRAYVLFVQRARLASIALEMLSSGLEDGLSFAFRQEGWLAHFNFQVDAKNVEAEIPLVLAAGEDRQVNKALLKSQLQFLKSDAYANLPNAILILRELPDAKNAVDYLSSHPIEQ
jgi:hypothetical protein